nr:MAG TPA: hypothetical protein [Bacteriophage sp.]
MIFFCKVLAYFCLYFFLYMVLGVLVVALSLGIIGREKASKYSYGTIFVTILVWPVLVGSIIAGLLVAAAINLSKKH